MLHRTTSRLVSNKGNDDTTKYRSKLEEEFDLGESLGKGGYGQIFKAKRKSDNNQFAIKIIKFESNMDDLDTIRREANLLAKLNHKNIVSYFNSWIDAAHVPSLEYEKYEDENLYSEIQKWSLDGYINVDETSDDEDNLKDDELEGEYSDEYDDYSESEDDDADDSFVTFQRNYTELRFLYIQMELCEKRNLRTAIENNLYLDENKLMKHFKEICEGLAYIHKNHIAHRDLKPENIFLTSNDTIKIGDFGLSKQISLENDFDAFQNEALPYGSMTATLGTLVYIAPELIRGNRFNTKADIYSLGVIYLEMCSKPMTNMEMSFIFPLTQEKWKTINFPVNNNSKKNLLKTLLHTDHHERPTCEQILKVLNSVKSTEEIKEVIQQSRRVTNQERKSFERALKSINVERTEVTNFFLKKAVEIFKLHGGENIPMPTFMPSFPNYSSNLTALLNTGGNSTSLSNTSRFAFSYYVANNRIQKIRRYSTERIYEEGNYSPTELQECVFQIVGSEPDDFVTDAEMLYVTHKLLNDVFPNEKRKLIIINHGFIFAEILKWCGLSKKDSFTLTNLLINSNFITAQTSSCLQLDKRVELFLHKIMKFYDFGNSEKFLSEILGSSDLLQTGFKQLKVIIENARKFGMAENWTIYLAPLLVNQKYVSGFMFQAICGTEIVASGGSFDSLIRRCDLKRRRKPLNISAVDVSFNVERIVQLLLPLHKSSSAVDVVLVAKNKAMAISLYLKLLSHKVKCEIVNEYGYLDEPAQKPSIIIQLQQEDVCVMYRLKDNGISRTLEKVFTGQWKREEFSEILLSIVRPIQVSNMISPDMLQSLISQIMSKLQQQNLSK